MQLNTPQLRVCVIPQCNLHCVYCRPGGEGYYENMHVCMSPDEIIAIISLCAKIGFTHIKLTGGEPLLRPDLAMIIETAKHIPGIHEIQMVTNGTLLAGRVAELYAAGLDWITVSLDAADAEAFRQIRKTDLSPILDALCECHDIGLPVRINMVVMKSNVDQIPHMIKLASDTGCSLKLLDLICLNPNEDIDFWRQEFIHFDQVRPILEGLEATLVGLEEAPGGIGAPLTDYRLPSGLQVVVKDSTRGTYYHDSCKDCRNYPCQDALISVRVTHDGSLKRCLVRNDNLVALLPLLRSGRTDEVASEIRAVFNLMTESSYHPFAWNPGRLIERSPERTQL